MSLKFRQAFKETLGSCFGKKPNRFGKFAGSGSSYTQVRLNSAIRSSISRTDFSLICDTTKTLVTNEIISTNTINCKAVMSKGNDCNQLSLSARSSLSNDSIQMSNKSEVILLMSKSMANNSDL